MRGYSSAPVHVTAAATSDGFDWIDALIGGVGGIATALLIMGGAFLLLSQRNRPRPTHAAATIAGVVFALVAASAADAKSYVNGPYSTASAGNQIEVIGDHGSTGAQLSRAKVEAMRSQAMADFYSHKTPITTEHSFGASKQRHPGNQIDVIGDHGSTGTQLSRAEVEGMRWQAMADFYSHKTPITTEHSFGASKQRPTEPTVVSVASPVSLRLV